jgi:hypothetical protein
MDNPELYRNKRSIRMRKLKTYKNLYRKGGKGEKQYVSLKKAPVKKEISKMHNIEIFQKGSQIIKPTRKTDTQLTGKMFRTQKEAQTVINSKEKVLKDRFKSI